MSKILVIIISLGIGIYAYIKLFIDIIPSEVHYAVMSGIALFTVLVGSLQLLSILAIHDKRFAADIKQKKAACMKKKYENDNNHNLEILIVFGISIISFIFMFINYDILTTKREYTHIIANLIPRNKDKFEDLITFSTIAAFAVFFLSAYIPIFFKRN